MFTKFAGPTPDIRVDPMILTGVLDPGGVDPAYPDIHNKIYPKLYQNIKDNIFGI